MNRGDYSLSKQSYIVIFLIAIAYVAVSGYLEYTSIINPKYDYNMPSNISSYISETDVPESSTSTYNRFKNFKQVSENEYVSDKYDTKITLPLDYRITTNTENSLFIGNEQNESMIVSFLSNDLEEYATKEIDRYKSLFNEVEEFSARISDCDYIGIAGYQISKDFSGTEHRIFLRKIPNSKNIISIEAHFNYGDFPVLGTIFERNGNSGFEIYAEKMIKSLEDAQPAKEYIRDPREDIEPNLFAKGTWDKNVYTNDLLDLKITMPAYWGYSTSIDNYFDISSPDIDEFIQIRVLNNTAIDEMSLDVDNLKIGHLNDKFEYFTCNISDDEYIGFTHVQDFEKQDSYFYREVNGGEYLLRIYTYMKPETLDMLGIIFEKNGNSKVTFIKK